MQGSKLRTATAVSDPMILEIDTSLGSGSVGINLKGTSPAVVIDWGDGVVEPFNTTGTKSHTYAVAGVYTIEVRGRLTWFSLNGNPQYTKCLSFGTIGLTSLEEAFRACSNLIVAPDVLPETITNLREAFYFCDNFNYDIGGWDTSNVTTMRSLFSYAPLFNQDIGGWDTSAVVDMTYMFNNASAFNQPIGGWDVSNVVDFYFMFQSAINFNQNIGSWDVSSAIFMTGMFYDAAAFNQDIGEWDTVNLEVADVMFQFATNFNQDLTGWCVGNIGSEPDRFADSSALTAGNKPVWGTCPTYIANGSITYVGEATGTTSATLPAHQAGDLILAFAFRDGSTTLPTQPAGWTLLESNTASSSSARLSYKIAASSSESTGTWTNASTVIFLVYRGVNTTAIGFHDSEASGTFGPVLYRANGYWQNLSRMVAFAGHRATDTALGTPPGTLTLIVNPVDATDEAAAFQSTVDNFGNWVDTSVSVGGTTSGWITFTMRLRVPIVPA